MDSLAEDLNVSIARNIADHDSESSFWFDASLVRAAEKVEMTTVDPSMLSADWMSAALKRPAPEIWDGIGAQTADPRMFTAQVVNNVPALTPIEIWELYTSACADLNAAIRSIEQNVEELVQTQPAQSAWGLSDFTTPEAKKVEIGLEYNLQAANTAATTKDCYHCTEQRQKTQRIASSDGSDISDQDNVDRLDAIFRGMRRLHQANRLHFWAITDLQLCDRRYIHAHAHFLGLGHITIGAKRVLLLSNRKDIFTDYLKRAIRNLRKTDNTPDGFLQSSVGERASRSLWDASDFRNAALPMTELVMQPVRFDSIATRMREPEYYDGHSSNTSSDSAASNGSVVSVLKRKRESRHKDAFVCHQDGCFERFDRRCDLTQHERSHLPYDQRPYSCESCEKRFLFPKDLRRHGATHASAQDEGNVVTIYNEDEALEMRRLSRDTKPKSRRKASGHSELTAFSGLAEDFLQSRQGLSLDS